MVPGYHEQLAADIDPDARVRDLVAGPHGAPGSPEDNNLMRRFLFTGDLPFARAGSLSGGERRRLQLLLLVAARPNVLFLDEPTNDLDLDTLRELEDFLEDWPGALLVVSHDRTFLDRVTKRLVEVSSDGEVSEVPGGVEGWFERTRTQDGRAEAGTAGTSTGEAGTPKASTPEAGMPKGRRERARPVTAERINPSRRARLVREAEREMARLQGEVARIDEALGTASGYREMAALGQELADAQAALHKAEESWLELAVDD